ncbi:MULTISPECIES: replicative DNA helicase [Streptomyces]|uniref:replicative DNA helicase n=1 Tax=Streptomyces TaxID=1883 RepID=UPI0004CD181F|nr:MULTISPECIES: replicative DNA helicase [Streptomyces]KOT49944.1 DNA helicase [Streptomyces rimosus subsp. rimosus]
MSDILWAEDDMPAGPAALDDERILAASVMARPELVDELAASGFDPADITTDALRWVWYAVEEVHTAIGDGAIPWQAVDRQLQTWRADGTMPVPPLTRVQLSDLYASAMPGSAEWHADQVTKAAVAARLVALGHDARLKGMSPAFDPDADVAALQAALDGVVRPEQAGQAATIGDLLPGALERAVTPPKPGERIPTGFIDLDGLFTGGWAPGQMVVVGARPAMGKTTLAIGLARAAAVRNKIPTLVRSLEMSADDLANGVLSAEARIPLHHIKQGIVNDDGVARAARASEHIVPAPLHIDDQPLLTLPGLRAQVRQLVRTAGLRLVVIDYLQLMQAPRAENRQVAVSMISRGLKLMAKEFGIAIIVLAQLNRGPEQRTDRKPMVSDLRESGSIEQDADIVILLHREDAYEKDSPRAGEADLIVGKHRGGPTATITTAFQGHYARFVDMAQT